MNVDKKKKQQNNPNQTIIRTHEISVNKVEYLQGKNTKNKKKKIIVKQLWSINNSQSIDLI